MCVGGRDLLPHCHLRDKDVLYRALWPRGLVQDGLGFTLGLNGEELGLVGHGLLREGGGASIEKKGK